MLDFKLVSPWRRALIYRLFSRETNHSFCQGCCLFHSADSNCWICILGTYFLVLAFRYRRIGMLEMYDSVPVM